MCGISGCLTTDNTAVVCAVEAIDRMQNRGYDSCGFGTSINQSHLIQKEIKTNDICPILELQKKAQTYQSNIAVAHTRWATHGSVCLENAHPHSSDDNTICLVHNGIIENYAELRQIIQSHSYVLSGTTDSEILCKYIHHELEGGSDLSDIQSKLTGSWAVLFMWSKDPNKLFYLKNGSPMVVGLAADRSMIQIVSELSAFDKRIDSYHLIPDTDCGFITIDLINSRLPLKDAYQLIKEDYVSTPYPFDHWTLKEITEQPAAVSRCLEHRLVNNSVVLDELSDIRSDLMTADHLIFLACGTSYHAAKVGVGLMRSVGIRCSMDVIDGADFEADQIPTGRKVFMFVLSQSGETKDLIRGVEIANSQHIKSVGLINVEHSTLCRMVSSTLYLRAGRENAVASTKCFVTQCVLLALIGCWIKPSDSMIKALSNFFLDSQQMIDQTKLQIDSIIDLIHDKSSLFVLGKGVAEMIAREGALKIKEITYVHAEGYASTSLKHGPFALLDENTPVIIINPADSHQSKNDNIIQEIRSRFAPVIQITNICQNKSDNCMYYSIDSMLFDVLSVIPLQMIAYGVSTRKSINPDFPRNLAKVVTVE